MADKELDQPHHERLHPLVLLCIMANICGSVLMILQDFSGPVDAFFLFPTELFLMTVFGLTLVKIWQLVVESVLELKFVYWHHRHDTSATLDPEASPLLGSCPSPVVGEYRAVDVVKVDLATLGEGARVQSLPTRLVQLPVTDTSQIAVLSWKWDFENHALYDPSRNVACAIRYAKARGIRYLFIDCISLDQTLEPGTLIAEVTRFGKLYGTIPVIAAYDYPRFDLRYVMLRPWIYSEIKLMYHNPHRIAYVGYSEQGTHDKTASGCPISLKHVLGRIPRSQMHRTRISRHLRRLWESDFVTTIVEILNGIIHMANIHDFKFILPPLAEVFIAAEHLDRNDYLLTVALMVIASAGRDAYTVNSAFVALPYTKLRIDSLVQDDELPDQEWIASPEFRYYEHREVHEIYWGDKELAVLAFYSPKWMKTSIPYYRFSICPKMEQNVFQMLGLSPGAYMQYVQCESERRTYLGGREVLGDPKIDVVELPYNGSWS